MSGIEFGSDTVGREDASLVVEGAEAGAGAAGGADFRVLVQDDAAAIRITAAVTMVQRVEGFISEKEVCPPGDRDPPVDNPWLVIGGSTETAPSPGPRGNLVSEIRDSGRTTVLVNRQKKINALRTDFREAEIAPNSAQSSGVRSRPYSSRMLRLTCFSAASLVASRMTGGA